MKLLRKYSGLVVGSELLYALWFGVFLADRFARRASVDYVSLFVIAGDNRLCICFAGNTSSSRRTERIIDGEKTSLSLCSLEKHANVDGRPNGDGYGQADWSRMNSSRLTCLVLPLFPPKLFLWRFLRLAPRSLPTSPDGESPLAPACCRCRCHCCSSSCSYVQAS